MMDSFEEWYANQFHYKKIDGTPPGQNWAHTLSVHDVAVLLGVSDSAVYDILRTKPLPTITVSGKRRIEKESFEKWYSAQSHYKKVSERSELMFEEKVAELNGKKQKGSYTVAEVQKILGISRPAVYALIGQHLFRTVMLDNQYRIVKSSFDAWLDGKIKEVLIWLRL